MLSQDSIEKLANHLRAEGTPESHALLTQIQTELEQDARRQELSVQAVNSVLNLLVQFGHPEAKVGDTLRDLLNVQSWSSVMPSEEDINATGLVAKVLYALEAYHEHQFDASIDALAEAVQIFRILWEEDQIVEARVAMTELTKHLGRLPPHILEILSQQITDAASTGALNTYRERSHLRRISCFTMSNGAYNHFVNRIARRKRPAELSAAKAGFLELTDTREQIQFKRAMSFSGYHLFGPRLSDDQCERLRAVSYRVKGYPTGPEADSKTLVEYHSLKKTTDGFWCDSNELINQPEIQELLADPSFEHAARLYLGTEPYLVGVNMWWSFPSNATAERRSEMAQHFHFDADFNHFINFFVHLTDTDADSGAHVFVSGSHRPGNKPQDLLNRGYVRISDNELAEYHEPQKFTVASVKAGSVLAGDTRCWHRGSHPTTHARLMLEFVFADTLATSCGKGRYTLGTKVSPAFRQRIEESPAVYQCQTLGW